MVIDRFFTKTVIQRRKKSGTGATVEDWEDITSDLQCAIAPIYPSDTLAFPSDYFRTNITHKMFCWSSEDIRIDDKLVYGGFPEIPYKPAATATISYKPASSAEIPYKPAAGENDEYLVKKINDWDSFYEVYLSEVK